MFSTPSENYINHDHLIKSNKSIRKSPKNHILCDVAIPFPFDKVILTEIINEMKNLDESKATQYNAIPTKLKKKKSMTIIKHFDDIIETFAFPRIT